MIYNLTRYAIAAHLEPDIKDRPKLYRELLVTPMYEKEPEKAARSLYVLYLSEREIGETQQGLLIEPSIYDFMRQLCTVPLYIPVLGGSEVVGYRLMQSP